MKKKSLIYKLREFDLCTTGTPIKNFHNDSIIKLIINQHEQFSKIFLKEYAPKKHLGILLKKFVVTYLEAYIRKDSCFRV